MLFLSLKFKSTENLLLCITVFVLSEFVLQYCSEQVISHCDFEHQILFARQIRTNNHLKWS